MWKVVESSVFLRTLNFVRVKHPHRLRYNFVAPMTMTLVGLLLLTLPHLPNYDIDLTSFTKPILGALAVFIPFFLASLAAVSTFSGPSGFDEPFKMDKPVTLLISHRSGGKEIEVAPRYFLSLLFGYNTVVSFFLIVVLAFESAVPIGAYLEHCKWFILLKYIYAGVVLFLLAQMAVFLLVAVYYLSDYVHRIDRRNL